MRYGPRPFAPSARAGRVGKIDVAPTVRRYYVTGVEWKGTTGAESPDPPSTDPTTLSLGYRYKAPGFDGANPQNWQVTSYIWTPGSMIAYEGDTVELKTFILNGNDHLARLIGPDGNQVRTLDTRYRRGTSPPSRAIGGISPPKRIVFEGTAS